MSPIGDLPAGKEIADGIKVEVTANDIGEVSLSILDKLKIDRLQVPRFSPEDKSAEQFRISYNEFRNHVVQSTLDGYQKMLRKSKKSDFEGFNKFKTPKPTKFRVDHDDLNVNYSRFKYGYHGISSDPNDPNCQHRQLVQHIPGDDMAGYASGGWKRIETLKYFENINK